MDTKHNAPPLNPNSSTLLNALNDIRYKLLSQHGVEATIHITIQNWNSTLHLANLVIHDMTTNQKKDWQIEYHDIPDYFGKGKLQCLEACGQDEKKGLTITIYKQTNQKKHQHRPSNTSVKNYGSIAMAIHQVHSILYDLYGATGKVTVDCEVIRGVGDSENDDTKSDEEQIIKMLSSIREGTKWTEQIDEVWFTKSHGRKYYKLLSSNTEFKILTPLNKH